MQRYLLAVDDSPEAEAAARWLGEVCRTQGDAEVVVLHVFDPEAYHGEDPLDIAMAATRYHLFKRLMPILGVPARGIVRVGRPAAVIAKAASSLGATAIVLGHRPRVGLRRRLHIGVGDRLERSAPCTVVAIAA